VILEDLASSGDISFFEWINERKNRRVILRRLEACKYVRIDNPDNAGRYWAVGGKRKVIYAKSDLPLNAQIAAAQARQRQGL
jgi:hypothetical protein